MRTLLICHEDALLTREGIARWLASFSDLVGIIALRESRRQFSRRVRREMKRVGLLCFLDVLAFRVYDRLFLSARDRAWEREKLRQLCVRYPPVLDHVPVLRTHSPNTPEAERFVRARSPHLMVARCKMLLEERVFSIPARGTFVFHPGICPEYRNAHGCFWALASDDRSRVGMTLLRIDSGVDTGPVYGQYSYAFDELNESPTVIQHRVVLENLDPLREKLLQVCNGSAIPLDTAGRPSKAWGQPWLTRYLRWKRQARRRAVRALSLLYHDVVEDGDFDSSGRPGWASATFKLKAEEFRRHVAAIAATARSRPITVFDLLDGRVEGLPLLLTFDDGGSSVYRPIADLLENVGWRGHFFIITNSIGTSGFLSARQIRELRQRGHVIGSHSRSHPRRMSSCSWEELLEEWAGSVRVLSDLLGEAVSVASVPGGYYSPKVARAAAHAGIRALFTSEPTTRGTVVDGCWVLGRYGMRRGSPAHLPAALAAGRRMPRVRQRALWEAKKIAKGVGGESYLRIRNLLLR